jgi:outer membrane receptor for ferrienterochelin and colicin
MRKIITFLICFLYSLLCCSIMYASTTGKISGLITDAETNQVLPGTNVVIEGTLMGASSDLDGYYFIINVPPGNYTLRISQIGYKEVIIRDLVVSSDMTTVQNVKLSPTVLETDEVVIVEAERPLVRMDMTSSLESVSSDEIEALPVRTVNDVLALQAGIIRSGGNIHIRGGRSSEVAYWVDGISTTDAYNGSMGLTVENAAIDELQVISGTFNAEYGESMSGIINMITKEGGSKYSGRLEVYAGDFLSNDPVYNVLKNFSPDTINGQPELVGEEEESLMKFNPVYNGEITLNGPVPGLGKYLSFFTTTRYNQSDGYLYGRRLYTPYGTPGDSSLVPISPSKRLSTQGKLTYRMGPNIKINYTVFYNQFENESIYAPPYRTNFLINMGAYNYQGYKYNPDGIPQEEGYGMDHILTLNHVLSPRTYYELRVNHHYNEYKRYVYKNPLATPRYVIHVLAYPELGIPDTTLSLTSTSDLAYLDMLQEEKVTYNDITWEVIPDPGGPEGYVSTSYLSAPTGNSYFNSGLDMEHERRSTSYWTGKLDLTSQVNKAHLFKMGMEFTQYELDVDIYTLISKQKPASDFDFFEPAIPDESNLNRNKYNRKPVKFAAYLQDKMEIGKNIIINAGLRFDYFDVKSVIPADPRDLDIYNPLQKKNQYKNWVDYPDTVDTPPEMDAWEARFTEYTPDERRAFMHKEVDPKMQMSPRLGIAYPISSEGVIHFSYGHFFQIPPFQFLYYLPDFKTGETGNYLFGNADLEPQRTIAYEIGLQQQLTEDIGIDITLFYRDIRDWIGTSPMVKTYLVSKQVSFYENKDYSNVRGVTLRFEKRQSNYFSTRFDYTFQIADGTYSNPRDAFNAALANNEPRRSLIPLDWDQQHTLNGSFIFSMSNWTVSFVGFYWSGTPYTPTQPYGESVSGYTKPFQTNAARKPSQARLDLNINKRIYMGTLYFDLFCNIYNLFDTRNATNVYQDTGTPDHNTFLDPGRVPYDPDRIGTIEDFERQPSWYAAPREINVGLAIGF